MTLRLPVILAIASFAILAHADEGKFSGVWRGEEGNMVVGQDGRILHSRFGNGHLQHDHTLAEDHTTAHFDKGGDWAMEVNEKNLSIRRGNNQEDFVRVTHGLRQPSSEQPSGPDFNQRWDDSAGQLPDGGSIFQNGH
jgi:hypothetical protein